MIQPTLLPPALAGRAGGGRGGQSVGGPGPPVGVASRGLCPRPALGAYPRAPGPRPPAPCRPFDNVWCTRAPAHGWEGAVAAAAVAAGRGGPRRAPTAVRPHSRHLGAARPQGALSGIRRSPRSCGPRLGGLDPSRARLRSRGSRGPPPALRCAPGRAGGGVPGTPRSRCPSRSLSGTRPRSCLSAPQMQPQDAPGCGWTRRPQPCAAPQGCIPSGFSQMGRGGRRSLGTPPHPPGGPDSAGSALEGCPVGGQARLVLEALGWARPDLLPPGSRSPAGSLDPLLDWQEESFAGGMWVLQAPAAQDGRSQEWALCSQEPQLGGC